jgi:acyl-CoA reductase-like NAD-dependent aldehyde dehydrogenase
VQPSRLIVEESVYDEFCAKLVAISQSFKFGHWKEEGVNKGPIVSQAQMDKILGYIQSGKDDGFDLLCGGNKIDRDGFFIEPTVFGNVDNKSKIA